MTRTRRGTATPRGDDAWADHLKGKTHAKNERRREREREAEANGMGHEASIGKRKLATL